MTDQDKKKILDMFSEKENIEQKIEKHDKQEEVAPDEEAEDVFDIAEILKDVEDSQGGIEKAGVKINSVTAEDDLVEEGQEKEEVKKGSDSIALLETAEEKIEKIVLLAQEKGPVFAIKVARNLQDNYVLDATQGELTEDDVYQELVKRGLISENL